MQWEGLISPNDLIMIEIPRYNELSSNMIAKMDVQMSERKAKLVAKPGLMVMTEAPKSWRAVWETLNGRIYTGCVKLRNDLEAAFKSDVDVIGICPVAHMALRPAF
jgi:hypothetical protein